MDDNLPRIQVQVKVLVLMMTPFDMLEGWLRTFTHKRRQSLTLTGSCDALQRWLHWHFDSCSSFLRASDHPFCICYIYTDYEKTRKVNIPTTWRQEVSRIWPIKTYKTAITSVGVEPRAISRSSRHHIQPACAPSLCQLAHVTNLALPCENSTSSLIVHCSNMCIFGRWVVDTPDG